MIHGGPRADVSPSWARPWGAARPQGTGRHARREHAGGRGAGADGALRAGPHRSRGKGARRSLEDCHAPRRAHE
eukprot:15222036-Alexandrium_andersonii.AAC.1